MLERRIDGRAGSRPVPVSFIIQTASRFGCNIYIRSAKTTVNAKCYDEMQNCLSSQSNHMVFYFDGEDENEADKKFQKIFQMD